MADYHWHNLSWEEVVRTLDSDIGKGLTEKAAADRQKNFGLNLLPEEKPFSRLGIFFEQFKSPLIYILVIAGIIVLFFQKFTDAVVIFGAVFLNTLVGYFQEKKAGQALSSLKKIVKIEAQVIREGNELKVNSEDLVPGDIIVLTSGNKVPADGRLIEVHNLKINEAPLTGEWLPAQKSIEVLAEDTPLADRDNMVYAGGMVEDGKGKAIVTAVGVKTEMGKIASLVKETKDDKTPLQKKLAHFSKIVGIIIGVVAVLVFIGGLAKEGDFLTMFETAVAVAVAAIPEGLPVAMTVILALGMQRILKRKGLVRKLVAAETLGSTSIIATDKTLTLTEGKMAVAKTVTLKTEISAQDKLPWSSVFKEKAKQDQIFLLTIATLTNEAFVENPHDIYTLWRLRGRPTDKSLLLAGAEVGLRKEELLQIYPKIEEIPFNPQNKFIALLIQAKPLHHQKEANSLRKVKVSLIRDPIIHGSEEALLVSGAPEKILGFSSHVQADGHVKKVDEEVLNELNQELESLTSQGLRVVATAYKKIQKTKGQSRNLEKEINDLTFVGFIGLKDPLREEAKEAIASCKKAGMRPIMVTGDHVLTAKVIGRELGLRTKKENIIEGKDLEKLSEDEFQKKVKNIDIYARVEPAHKLKIIEAWQKRGEVVAMTGDGINDAPALRKADVGVALGSGTDVAKEVSDLVLLTDNFNIIVAAVEEGRAIIDNIRKVITYLLSDSFTETILVGVSIILGWPLPITAVQILWVNLIEDGLPGIALAFEPKEKGVLERKPEGKNVKLLTREMKVIIFIIGFLTDFVLLVLLWWLLRGSYDMQHIRTIIFACLGIDSIFYVFSCKNLRRNIWHFNPFSNLFLVGAWAVGILALLAALYLPVFNTLLQTVPLGVSDWLLVISLGLLNLLLIELAKHYFIVRHQTE
ncbi:MAG: ATPase [Candidatus Nealsonbacteria bacterium CG09_land_8_20_14_0_10_42_14]|uniref:ATPase n=1 Tax=Candidatus Nealsonbacteria bacterium CG09_land_8_20_14_0_10_42_14 TaxID=1974707 RepID=A0A2H0WXR7_9BACT|nr:MAG: ATPase [Candidatus Nealsonbacteria bacterium CG09_land_8_20_14_0_10_42_14]